MKFSFPSLIALQTRLSSKYAVFASLPLRMIVGYGFIAHGYAKLARGPEHFIATLDALGVPFAQLMGWLTILVEIVGGFAVLAGAFVPLASLPLAVILLVALFKVHLPFGFSSIKLQTVTADGPVFGKPGYELSLLYLVSLVTLVLGGTGPWSVDGFLSRRGAHAKSERSESASD